MEIFFDVRVTYYLGIGLLVAAATFGFASSAQARVLFGSPGTAALSKGLVGYWPLDGAVTNWATGQTRDLSGNGNTGSLFFMSTVTSPTAGKIGQALNFSGGDDEGMLTSETMPNSNSPFTIALWMKPRSLGCATMCSIMNNETYAVSGFRFAVGSESANKIYLLDRRGRGHN